MNPQVLMILAAGLLVAGDDPKEEVAKLQGTWAMAALEINGQSLGDEQVKSGRLTIKDDRYEAEVAATTVKATIKVDTAKDPKVIDFTFTDGPNQGETSKGIYKLEGDTLTICRPYQGGGDRPTKFAAEDGSGLLLVKYKRVKDAPK